MIEIKNPTEEDDLANIDAEYENELSKGKKVENEVKEAT